MPEKQLSAISYQLSAIVKPFPANCKLQAFYHPRIPKPTAALVRGLILVLVLGVFSTPALAHRVLVFAYAEGDTIFTESKFVPNNPVRQGKILVQDAKTGQTLLTGTTDDQGKFSFKIPAQAAAQKMDLKIIAEAAMGHRGEWLLKAANYLGKGQAAGTPAPAALAPTPAATATPAPAAAKAGSVDQQALEAALNKALERQLAPINEKLTDLTIHRTTLPDILGGIGYILGLCGVAAYFLSKRQKNA
jgi:nickel transport protein